MSDNNDKRDKLAEEHETAHYLNRDQKLSYKCGFDAGVESVRDERRGYVHLETLKQLVEAQTERDQFWKICCERAEEAKRLRIRVNELLADNDVLEHRLTKLEKGSRE